MTYHAHGRSRALGDDIRSPTSTEVRSPTSTSTEVRSPTSTSTEVRSPTSTSTEVRSPTSTTTDAYTAGNMTVTGGAGAGATFVWIGVTPPWMRKAELRQQGGARPSSWVPGMMRAGTAPRVASPMRNMFEAGSPRASTPMPGMFERSSPRAPMPETMRMSGFDPCDGHPGGAAAPGMEKFQLQELCAKKTRPRGAMGYGPALEQWGIGAVAPKPVLVTPGAPTASQQERARVARIKNIATIAGIGLLSYAGYKQMGSWVGVPTGATVGIGIATALEHDDGQSMIGKWPLAGLATAALWAASGVMRVGYRVVKGSK